MPQTSSWHLNRLKIPTQKKSSHHPEDEKNSIMEIQQKNKWMHSETLEEATDPNFCFITDCFIFISISSWKMFQQQFNSEEAKDEKKLRKKVSDTELVFIFLLTKVSNDNKNDVCYLKLCYVKLHKKVKWLFLFKKIQINCHLMEIWHNIQSHNKAKKIWIIWKLTRA